MDNIPLVHLEPYLGISIVLICSTLSGAVGHKKRNTFINSYTNYCREMKPVPINVDYCLLQFDALIFVLGVRLHGGEICT